MMFKSFEEEQQEMEINMYKYILEGKQHSFPFGYWVETGAKETFKKFDSWSKTYITIQESI